MINATEPRVITREAAKPSDPGHSEDPSPTEATLRRLNSQIRWYDVQAVRNDFAYKSLRVISRPPQPQPRAGRLSAPAVGGAVLGAGSSSSRVRMRRFQFRATPSLSG